MSTWEAAIKPENIVAKLESYFSLGGIYNGEDNFLEAIQMYTKVVALRENHLWGWQMLANASFHAGDNDKARAAWKRAVSLAKERLEVNTSDSEALKILACAHAMLGERERALAAINHLLAQEHKTFDLFKQVGIAYEVLGERDLALEFIEKAVKNELAPIDLQGVQWLNSLRSDSRYQKLIQPYMARK